MRWPLLLLLLLLFTPPLAAAGEPANDAAPGVTLHLFWRDGCPHCERAIHYLSTLPSQLPGLTIAAYEVGSDPEAQRWLERISERLALERVAVPLILVGPNVFIGYDQDDATGQQIRATIEACLATPCPDPLPALLAGGAAATPATVSPLPEQIDLPLFGPVDPRTLSLPLLTVVLAALDGFNPCAMWTLIFLLGLLIGIGDRLRMWLLGGAFIAASAAVYFLFMAAWLNTLLLLGAVTWLRWAVGLLALGGGGYYLLEFWRNPAGACRVTGAPRRQRVLERLKGLAGERNFLLALTGIVLLAVAVNLIELLCSAGLPAIYTQVLTLSALPRWHYYAYLLLYIAIFMLDDLLVFVIAMQTLRVSGLSGGYARWSHLIGGGVLLAIGLLLLLHPEWLHFA